MSRRAIVNTKPCRASTIRRFRPWRLCPPAKRDDTQRIVERFGEDILAAGLHNGQQMVYVKPDKLVELAEFVKTRTTACTTRP